MALVDDLLAAVPAPASRFPVEIARKLATGRTTGAAVAIQQRCAEAPERTEQILSRELRAARYLHSRERRAVQEGLYELVRHRAVVDAVLELGVGGDPSLARWLAWLVLQGLPPQDATAIFELAEGGAAPAFAALLGLPDAVRSLVDGADALGALELVGSMGAPLAAALQRSVGEGVGAFLCASNRRAPLVLRAHAGRGSREEIAERLVSEGLKTTPTPWARWGLVAARQLDLRTLPAYRDGAVEVQDEGSQLLAELAAALVPPGGRVVDYCAGAGGKTLALAALCPDSPISSRDVRSRALGELERRARRARVRALDVRVLPRSRGAGAPMAPLVLVDAPCSGTGTLRRHPDLRLRLGADELASLPARQLAILRRASRAVEPGGALVYATCSVLDEENQAVVESFLGREHGFALEPIAAAVGDARALVVGDGTFLRVAPHTHGTDGFFAAVLRRS